MNKDTFIKLLREAVSDFKQKISTPDGNWIVKGFIDTYKTIYTISNDTKVVSKIVELYIFPNILKFAKDNGLELELTKEQNYYPDITFKDGEDCTRQTGKWEYKKYRFRLQNIRSGKRKWYFC